MHKLKLSFNSDFCLCISLSGKIQVHHSILNLGSDPHFLFIFSKNNRKIKSMRIF